MPDAPYIQTLSVKNFGCIRDAEFPLTRLHAFVGPNDSGKSTILKAVQAAVGKVDHAPYRPDSRCQISFDEVTIFASNFGIKRQVTFEMPSHRGYAPSVLMLRLDPDALRKGTDLIPSAERVKFRDDRGTGLPSIYDAIFGRDPDAFFAIRNRLLELFPYVSKLGWRNVTPAEKQLDIELKDGTRASADQMSEGMLYWLAFAALPHISDVDVVLVEEPENGLHPARIVEIMRVLRDLSQRTQVLIATHSPLVINELEPDEVTVVTRDPEEGTRGVLMKDTADFESRFKVYALGELWLSYANGVDEKPLIKGGPRP